MRLYVGPPGPCRLFVDDDELEAMRAAAQEGRPPDLPDYVHEHLLVHEHECPPAQVNGLRTTLFGVDVVLEHAPRPEPRD